MPWPVGSQPIVTPNAPGEEPQNPNQPVSPLWEQAKPIGTGGAESGSRQYTADEASGGTFMQQVEQKAFGPEYAPPDEGLAHHIARGVSNFGGGWAGVVPEMLLHPVQIAKSMAHMYQAGYGNDPTGLVNDLMPTIESFREHPEETAESLGGNLLGSAELPAIAGETPGLGPVGGLLKRGGIGLINRTVGAKTAGIPSEFTPGAGYFQAQADIGIPGSMRGFADAAESAKLSTGNAIDDVLNNYQGSGIPVSAYRSTVKNITNPARATLRGPYGPGVSSAMNERLGSIPMFPAKQEFATPRAIWDIKKDIGQNINWTDPTSVGIKSVGQQLAGRGTPKAPGLSPLIEDYVPEMRELNPRYSNLSDLEEATKAQANRSNPFLNFRRASELFGGAGSSLTGHSPMGSFAPLALDTMQSLTPVRTAGASAMYGLGRMLSPDTGIAGGAIPRPFGPMPVPPSWADTPIRWPQSGPFRSGSWSPFSGSDLMNDEPGKYQAPDLGNTISPVFGPVDMNYLSGQRPFIPPGDLNSTPPVTRNPEISVTPESEIPKGRSIWDDLGKDEEGSIKTPDWMRKVFDAWRVAGRPENLAEGTTPLDQAIMDMHTGYGRTPEAMKPTPTRPIDWMDRLFMHIGDPSNNYTLGDKGELVPIPVESKIGGNPPPIKSVFQPFTEPGAPRFTPSGEPRMGIPREPIEFPKPVTLPFNPNREGLPPISDITPVSKNPSVMDRLKNFAKDESGGINIRPSGIGNLDQMTKDLQFGKETKAWSDGLNKLMRDKQLANAEYARLKNNPNATPEAVHKAAAVWQQAEDDFARAHDASYPGPQRQPYASEAENKEVESLRSAVAKLKSAKDPKEIEAARAKVADLQNFLDRRYPMWATGRDPFWLSTPTPGKSLGELLNLLTSKTEEK